MDHIDISGLSINFEMHKGELNINGFTRILAEGETREALKANYKKYGRPHFTGLAGARRRESTPRLFMSGATGRLNRSQLKYPMPNQLRVYVKRCRDLKACDKNMIGEDSSDPYIVIQARSEKYKTATHYRTLDPLIDEEAILHCSDPSTVLHVSVMDEDVGMDDMVGQWIVTCKYLVMDPTYVDEHLCNIQCSDSYVYTEK